MPNKSTDERRGLSMIAAILLTALLLVSIALSAYFVFYYEGPVPQDHSHPPAIDLNVTEESDHLQLEWNQIPQDNEWGLYRFNIYRCYNGEDMVRIGVVDIYHTSYADYEVQRCRTCWYNIEAVQDPHVLKPDSSNYSPAYGSFGPTSLGKRVADAPSGLTIRPMDEKVALYWNEPVIDGGHWITSYLVYRGTSMEDLTLVGNQSIQAVYYGDTFYDQNLTNDVTYFYAVSADNTIGKSNLSSLASVQPRSAPQMAVTRLSSEKIFEYQRLQVNWSFVQDPALNITGYRLYLGQQSMGSGLFLVGSYSANQTPPVLVNLTYPHSSGVLFMAVEYGDGNLSYSEPSYAFLEPMMGGSVGVPLLLILLLIQIPCACVIVGFVIMKRKRT
jgi:hypothetical protein